MATMELPAGVTLDKLLQVYEKQRMYSERRAEQRTAFYKTEEGKEYNRKKAKEYYERNKETVQKKNKDRYHSKKLTPSPATPADT